MSRKKGEGVTDKSVQRLREKAAQIVYQIGEKRDQLREIVGEFEDILTSTSEGLEDLESGLDKLSQYL